MVRTVVIREAKSDDVVSFKVQTRASGLNRKLSVFRDFKVISSDLRVKYDVIRDAESDKVISYDIIPRTQEKRLVHQLPRAKREAKKGD